MKVYVEAKKLSDGSIVFDLFIEQEDQKIQMALSETDGYSADNVARDLANHLHKKTLEEVRFVSGYF